MFYRDDVDIVTILYNVYAHLQEDYDVVLIVSGLTGTGKSRFALNLLDTWYRVILRKSVIDDHINNISDDMVVWAERFKHLNKYDINIFDEGAKGLDSKEWQSKFAQALVRMFNVCRKKNFFSVIIHPNYFKVNKDFREDRLRALVYIPKRGGYKWYSREGIKWLNVNNESKGMKSMDLAHPIHDSKFPDYEGCLLKLYRQGSDEGVDNTIDETVSLLSKEKEKNFSVVNEIKEDVLRLKDKEGMTFRQISKELDVSLGTVSKAYYMNRK